MNTGAVNKSQTIFIPCVPQAAAAQSRAQQWVGLSISLSICMLAREKESVSL